MATGHLQGPPSWVRRGDGHSQKTASDARIISTNGPHTGTKIIEIYLQVVGEEERQMVSDAWEG
jgi:hypothetical protein